MSMSALPNFFTAYEAADEIGVSHAQVTRYVKNKLLPHKRIGNTLLIPKAAVKRFKRPPVGNPNFRKKMAH